MLAEIITIGDEILIGQIVDTNSAWIAQRLNEIGVRVKQISSVSDDRLHILEALQLASQRADIILITGGLGPTKDDITKKTLAEYFGVGFKRDEASLEVISQIFQKYNRPLLEINIQQADVPENCEVLLNKNGTAPGMWFEQDQKVYVSMPGVPFEMMYLVEEEVLPRVKAKFKLEAIVHHTILTAGIGESFLAETIASVEDNLPAHIKLAYLPKLGQVRLRLSAYGKDENQLKAEIKTYVEQIELLASAYIVTSEDKPLEKAVLDFMGSKQLTLSVAESCTGGYLSHLFTQHSGSSAVFLGGAVSYSNQLKESILGVAPETIQASGAVSEETVTAMVEGALRNFQSDYAIAISGVAGPGGGTEEKPVGTVWIAVASKQKVVAQKFKFGNRRQQNIERSAVNALIMLFKLLKEEHA
ncbi:competence/damage-inducible protein A [Pedobacter sp. SYSU D00535]|uniref:competence/damage-inducible protein A n=1 Tax=Pedobacter sp. SYSU D00535 TaxID=2810308 RepID=UPI001A975CD4|nr:competence/damage-inducible protein A [Pedobacter sp. SYSU D00535]